MDYLSKIFSSLTNAKFPGGVVGRNLLSAACVCFGLVILGVFVHPNVWFSVLVVAAIVTVYFRGSAVAKKFAMAHPELATLEGAQIATFHKAVQNYASKNNPAIPASQAAKAIESGDSSSMALEMDKLEKVRNDAEDA